MNISFKEWHVKNDKFKSLILSILGLDNNGLSNLVNTYKQDDLISKLNSLGEFVVLPKEIKNKVIANIQAGIGTIGDLINIASNY